MTITDWSVVGAYLAAMLALAWYLGRSQTSREDYFLASKGLPDWALATSIIATQCSTNSLLGAPAFVGFALAGGMIWLQYELAVPLAMLLLCYLFVPLHGAGIISIYAFLEQRLGLGSRLLASGSFLFFRGVATGVTVYGVASVVELVTGIGYGSAVLVLMGITITYDLLGGMKAVVISDVVQMLLLLCAIALGLYWLGPPLLGHGALLADRSTALVNDWGLTSGNSYGFWPMLFGGLFLYTAYYGCDQSQAQRLLSAASVRDTQRVLLLNGLLRFPLVFAYCLLGLGLAVYAQQHPDFLPSLPRTSSGDANINLVFPSFVTREFPAGFAGLVIVGIFAAAMSSIDSALNSLSASTVEDYVARFRDLDERQLFLVSKLSTLGWGLFAVAFSFQVERIAATVLESINKVGSMVNGPLLGLFLVAILSPGVGQRAAIVGFIGGLAANVACWLLAPTVSWLWWNVLGLAVGLLLTAAVARLSGRAVVASVTGLAAAVPRSIVTALLTAAAIIFAICLGFPASF
jgi:SSS family solute:Na+ symporter